MPEPPPDIPLSITHAVAFLLPCSVARGIAYLSDPAILLGALPSIERVVARQRGTYRLTLEPIRAFGHTLRPAAEITIATAEDHISIRSIAGTPYQIQSGEVPTRVQGTLSLLNSVPGCDVTGALQLVAAIPGRVVPPLMPRALVHRTAEGLLGLRLRQDTHAMARILVAGFPAWDADQQSLTGDQ